MVTEIHVPTDGEVEASLYRPQVRRWERGGVTVVEIDRTAGGSGVTVEIGLSELGARRLMLALGVNTNRYGPEVKSPAGRVGPGPNRVADLGPPARARTPVPTLSGGVPMTAIPNSTATYRYLNQSEKWAPKDRPSLLIAEMDPEWRYNASRWMEKRAKTLELLYSMGEIITMTSPTMVEVLGVDQDGRPVEGVRLSEAELMCESAVDAWDAVMESRADSPLAWVRTTPLYQALVRGLPPDPAELETLAQRAKHYNWCAIREGLDACTCPAQDPP